MASDYSGTLKRRLGIEQFRTGTDATGAVTGGWTATGALWAAMTAIGEPSADRAPRFAVSARAAVLDPRCRLRLNDRAFQVLSVQRDPGTPMRMRVLVEEVAP